MNVRFINEHNEIVNEPNEITVVHDILSQKTLQILLHIPLALIRQSLLNYH